MPSVADIFRGFRLSGSVLFCLGGMASGLAQPNFDTFGAGKKLDYLQSSSAAPTSQTILGDPNGPFHFSADISGNNLNLYSPIPKVTLPNSTSYNLAGNGVSMGLSSSHASKSALDAAYPNGTYTFTVGASTLPVALGTSDAYPAEIPQITNGTWDGGGKLVMNATAGATLSFNAFSNYTGGVGGIISFNLYNVTNNVVGSEIAAVESIALTGYSSDPALTTYLITPGLLLAERTYYAELSYGRIVQLNTSFLPAVGLATFVRTTGFLITTAAPATVPVIATQPASQTVNVGANVVLSVTASGNPAPAYQWRKEGNIISGATLATYSLSNVQTFDTGAYTVVVSNSAGQISSNAAVLTVNPPPVAPLFTTPPASQTVVEGVAVTFSAAASGTPTPTFQWQKGNVNINGATSASYVIGSAQLADAGTYTVIATNTAGSITSSGATLTVNAALSAPSITLQPVGQTVIEGLAVTFTCAASGNPMPAYQWQKGGVSISGAISANYSIASTGMGDAGSYTVVVGNGIGNVTSNPAVLNVQTSVVAPVFTTQPFSQTVTTGQAATLTVTVSGNPVPTYQWKRDGVNISGATGTTYSISRVTDDNSGAYTVVATNTGGSATSNAAVINSIPEGFDVAGYYARNLDVAAYYGSNTYGAWQHFYHYGLNEGRTYDLYFRVDEYLELNVDLKTVFGADRQAALMHWLIYGHPQEDRLGRVPIGFNVDNYLARYPDLQSVFGSITPTALRDVTVWNHYLNWGVREGRSDGDFEAYGYLALYSDLAAVYGNDIEAAAWHWYKYGRREGRRIPGGFDGLGYQERNSDLVVVYGNDLYGCWLHYRDTGVYEGRTYDELFRVLEYRARYPDVQAAYGNDLTGVLLHWLYYGRNEGRLGRNP